MESINIHWDEEIKDFRIPVVVRTKADSVFTEEELKHEGRLLHDLINQGLRAQLAMQSFVTGQLMIQLDFFPKTKAVLYSDRRSNLPQIPTVPSQLEKLSDALDNVPLEDIAARFLSALEGFDALVRSPIIPETANAVVATLDEYRTLGEHLNATLPHAIESFDTTMVQMGTSMVAFDSLSSRMGSAMDVFSAASKKTGIAMTPLLWLPRNRRCYGTNGQRAWLKFALMFDMQEHA